MEGSSKIHFKVRFQGAVAALALIVSAYVFAVLLLTNLTLAGRVQHTRVLATLVPAAGKLAGISAADGSSWHPDMETGQLIVLFGVGEAGNLGDIEYWRRVGALAEEIGTSVNLVGLCITSERCDEELDAESNLTLLSHMDPVQTHALTVGSERAEVFLIEDRNRASAIRLTQDVDAMAIQLADVARSISGRPTT